MRAVVVSVGSELIDGFLTDTNATYLAQEMAALGIELTGVSQVGDNLDRIVRTLQRGWEDADLIVTTGGIGPTDDDLTREAVAKLVNETPAVDEAILETIAGFFRSRGTEMPERNRKQAWLIPAAQSLPNPMGTAPGWFVQQGKKVVVSMPGVPREMRRMWQEQATPRLLPFLGDRVVVSRTLKTIGVGESSAEQMIAHLIARGDPILATYAKDDGVHVRITATGADRRTVQERVDRNVREVLAIFGDHFYGEEQVSLGSALLEPLVRTGNTLGMSESGSGGHVTALLAEEPAAVVHFQGGLVRAFEHVASAQGVDLFTHDAAKQVALLESISIRAQRKADFGYSIALRMIPGESDDRTRGEMAFALNGRYGSWTREHTFTARPSELRRRATLWGAEFLRTALNEATRDDSARL